MITDGDMDDILRDWMWQPGLPEGEGHWPHVHARLSVTPQVRRRRSRAWRVGPCTWAAGSRRSLVLILVAALAIAVGTAALVAGALPSLPVPLVATFAPGSIAYESDGVVSVVGPDGSRLVETGAPQPGEDTYPVIAFAPDRRHLATMWTTGTGSGARLDITTPDGGVTSSLSLEHYPLVGPPLFSWAPDGQRLATYGADADPRHLTIVDIDGRPVRTITLPQGAGGQEAYGAAMLPWSPDGRWIAVRDCVTPECDGNLRYLLVAADGSGSRPLIAASVAPGLEVSHQYLTWSPDGRAALDQWEPGRVEIVSSDGTSVQEVLLPSGLQPGEMSGALSWSPSGDRLAILAVDPGQAASQLVLVDEDLVVHVVARDPLDMQQAFRWSPDGQDFVYISQQEADPTGTQSIWSVPASGGAATQLVEGVDGWFDVAGSTH